MIPPSESPSRTTGPARAGAREPDRELEHAEIVLQGGVAAPALGEPVALAVDERASCSRACESAAASASWRRAWSPRP